MSSPAAQTVSMNFLDPNCDDPLLDNGSPANSRVPLQSARVLMLNGSMVEPKPSIDREGFCRVRDGNDIAALADPEADLAAYRSSLARFMKTLSGADEIVMFPNCLVRRQEHGEGPARKNAANYLHADMTGSGARDMERYLYPAPQYPEARRVVHFNLWRLLSKGPTNLPLAMCDLRSVRAEDTVEGGAYFPSIDRQIGTGFFHPSSHLRMIYFPDLRSDEVLVFKQHDSDMDGPSSVPHGAFLDPAAPRDAEPRVSIEARCMARWYG